MPRVAIERSAKWVEKQTKVGLHAVGGVSGLCLQVMGPNSRSWILRATMPNGDRRSMGLGPYPLVTLADAREAARKARLTIREQVDPIEATRAAKSALRATEAKAVTFKDAAEAYMAAHEAGWRNPKHAQQWSATLATYAYPVVGALSVSDVETAHVMKILEPIWKTKTETASRLRGRIENVLDWARARGYRTGENPARWKGHLDMMLAKPGQLRKVKPRKHHDAVPVDDIGNFMRDLRAIEGVSARCLEFVTLTAARSGEARGARWCEIDFDGKEGPVWVVPKERMKAHVEHRVPLSKQAVALLKAQPRYAHNDLVFPSPQTRTMLSDMAMGELMKRMGAKGVPHGMRGCFRTWAGDRTRYPREIAEAALAHTNGDKVERAYLHTDFFKRRARMMQDWADFISKPIEKAAGGNVVTMQGQNVA